MNVAVKMVSPRNQDSVKFPFWRHFLMLFPQIYSTVNGD
jgi:hypothetical protein